jgi:hypothetical protein
VVLARSSDGGRSFENYAWTETPFEAGGVFFGDYSGLAAYGGRVYGVWTEKPVPAAPKEKDKAAERPEEASTPKQGTVVKVGVADFTKKGAS